MVTIAFLGDLGSGKTTLCTRQAIKTKIIHPKKKLISNYTFNNYDFEQLDLMDLYLHHQDVRDMIICIDELYTMMDSRLSSSHRNKVESYFIAMTRKAKADLFVTMQYETFVDCRLSPFIKVKYIMEKIPLRKTVYISGQPFTYVTYHPYKFMCHLFDDRNSLRPLEKDFIFDGRRWFNEFNTFQYILPPDDIIRKIEIRDMKDKLQHKKLKDKLESIENGENEIKTRKNKKNIEQKL